jgi:BirA family transcriptional regulator, biotin operon repressor / biotin---[acetyl-CoA-carboxylase] ligase
VVARTPSTNADLVAAYRAGEPPGLALVAEHQTAGRGRLDRSWETPDRAALTVSFLARPSVPVARWPWLPLVAGIAVAEAVRRTTELSVVLKWPNDVLVDDRKLAGLLVERVERADGAGAVIGIGINVSQRHEELPLASATSLLLEGATPDRTDLLRAVGEELARGLAELEQGTDPRPAYVALCATLGRQVRVTQPGDRVVQGEAVDVDPDGRLVVRTAGGDERLGAGDVVHVRLQEGNGG